jgi:hypothetical protein
LTAPRITGKHSVGERERKLPVMQAIVYVNELFVMKLKQFCRPHVASTPKSHPQVEETLPTEEYSTTASKTK